ncbi:MAG: FecR domain-containing protein [Bacteroidetes bacterium]|nr:FecR domain-containing protein [Bacteroidota bacterium]MDA1120110.1 FecR domain-containing protein [Bacteroidota bacterium]
MAERVNELIFKYLAGQSSEEEKHLITNWRASSQSNEIEFQRIQDIWNAAEVPSFNPDVDKAWDCIRKATHPDPILSVSHKNVYAGLSVNQWVSGIAASFLIIAVVWLTTNRNNNWTALTSTNERQTEVSLPDGSIVWLRNGARLKYHFSSDERELVLNGEAFFKVEQNPEQPFTVGLGNAEIQVIGTSFFAKSVDNQYSQVSVSSGVVSFTDLSDEDKTTVLNTNEEAILEVESGNMIVGKVSNPNVLTWQTGLLIFNKTPLSAVITELSKYYTTPIQLEGDNLGNCLITSKFDNQSLEEVLSIICKLLSAELVTTESGFMLKGQGC